MAPEWLKWTGNNLFLTKNSLKYDLGGLGTIFGVLKISTSKNTMVLHYGGRDRKFQNSKNRPKSPKTILDTVLFVQVTCFSPIWTMWEPSRTFPGKILRGVKLTPPPKPGRGESEIWKTKSFAYIYIYIYIYILILIFLDIQKNFGRCQKLVLFIPNIALLTLLTITSYVFLIWVSKFEKSTFAVFWVSLWIWTSAKAPKKYLWLPDLAKNCSLYFL